MADVFISYSRSDADTARRFAEAFEKLGLSVWWDDALRSGDAFDEAIEQALKAARAVVVLWSRTSVASRWVRAEATIADRNRTLVPAMIEPCDRPIMFELTQTAELSHWRGDVTDKAWLALAADVQRLVGARTAPRAPRSKERAAAKTTAAAQAGKPSILVIPFVNMSGDSEQEYFSDGVTEDIITDLARVSALSVVSRNTAFTYKGKTVSAAKIAQALKVSHILEGSVRKSGNRVRITAQLLDAATDAQVWAERFDRTLDDIFAIQDDISKAIVSALKLRLAPDEARAIEQRSTKNPESYELYLMARELTRSGSERLKPVIIRICRKAVEIDPNFADAWALMSFAESELSQRGVEGYSNDGAREAAERAVAADPQCANAHAALAESIIRGPEMDWNKGRPLVETALRLDPDCYEAHMAAGNGGIASRNYPEAIVHFERAIELDEHAIRPAGMVVQAYQGIGDTENAEAASRRVLARCERVLAIEPDHSMALSFFVNALADLGEAERARAWTRRAILFDPDNARLHYNLACAMSRLQDAEAACDLLDGIIDRVSKGWLLWMGQDNSLDPMRDHPRFRAVMERGRARFGLSAP